jgi:hypothetical protein
MLSIQAHPDKHKAEEGYARENQAGISLSAPQRNYKDDNHTFEFSTHRIRKPRYQTVNADVRAPRERNPGPYEIRPDE